MRKKVVGTIAVILGGVFVASRIQLILERNSFPESFEALIFTMVGIVMIGGLFELWKS